MTFSLLDIRSTWHEDGLKPAEIGENIVRVLHELQPLDPAMSNWLLADGAHPRWATLAEALQAMPAFVQSNVKLDDWGKPSPEEGYVILIKGSEEPSEFGGPDAINLWVTAGARFENRVWFEVGESHLPRDLKLTTYPIYKGALRALADVWPCPWALASADPPKSPHAGVRPNSPFDMAWIGYLSAPLAAGLEPPGDLLAEPTPGGGVILSAVETLIDQANPDHVRRARLLEEIMVERVGLARWGFGPGDHAARIGAY